MKHLLTGSGRILKQLLILTTIFIYSQAFANCLYVGDPSARTIFIVDDALNVSPYLENVGFPTSIHFSSYGILHFWDAQSSTLFRVEGLGTIVPVFSKSHQVVDFAFDQQNNIYIIDSYLRKLYKYDYSGNLLFSMYDLNIGRSIIIDNNGNIYIGGMGDHYIHIYDTLGNEFPYVLGGAGGSNPKPTAFGDMGEVFAVSGGDGKVLKWSKNSYGYYDFSILAENFWWPGDLAVALNGDIYVSSSYPDNVGISIFDSTGHFLKSIKSTSFVGPVTIEFGPSQNPCTVPKPLTCTGFAPPMGKYRVRVKKNRVLPLKVQLFDSEGFAITPSDISEPPIIQILYKSTETALAEDVSSDAIPPGGATTGNQFLYVDGQWQFNLQTKCYSAPGTYEICIVSGDKSEYQITSPCKSSFVIE